MDRPPDKIVLPVPIDVLSVILELVIVPDDVKLVSVPTDVIWVWEAFTEKVLVVLVNPVPANGTNESTYAFVDASVGLTGTGTVTAPVWLVVPVTDNNPLIYKLFPMYLVYLILPLFSIGFFYLAYTKLIINTEFILILIFAVIFSIVFSLYKSYLLNAWTFFNISS